MSLSPVKLDFLRSLTDDTGLLQHAKFATPKRQEGYTTDDNSRALIACIKYCRIFGMHSDSEIARLIDIYLSFLLHMQEANGIWHNLLSYNRQFADEKGSEDSMGRALWACGCAMNSSLPVEKRMLSKEIFDRGFLWAPSFKSLRSKAFAIMGLANYKKAYPDDPNIVQNIRVLVSHLLSNYKHESSTDWRWFEPYLTYVNGRLPQALFEAYEGTSNEKYLETAKTSFDFLLEIHMIDDVFVPIGNKGWYKKREKRATYDQQSVEAACMVEAAIAAFRSTGEREYLKIAGKVFAWFLGKNLQCVKVYNPKTGGCYDGITPEGLNLNQGAEATVSYLAARLDLESAKSLL